MTAPSSRLDHRAREESGGVSPLRPVAGIALLVASALAVLLLGIGSGLQGSDRTMLALAVLQIVAGFLPMTLDTGRPYERRHVFLSMVSIVYGLGFGVPIINYYIPANGPIDPPGMSNVNVSNPDMIHAQILGLLGMLLIYGGYALPIRPFLSRVLRPPRFEWSERGALAAAFTLIPTGWLFYLAGLMNLIPAQVGRGFIGGFMDLAMVAPALLTATYLRYRTRLSMIAILILVPLSSILNIFTGSKHRILLPWAMVVLTYIVYTRRVQLRWLVAGVAAVALLYPAAQFVREVVLDGNTRSFREAASDPAAVLGSVASYVGTYSFGEYAQEGLDRAAARIDAVGHPAVIIRDTPSVVPFQGGWTLAQIFYSYIPRIAWPSKPTIGIGLWLNDTYNNSHIFVHSHLGPSWIGEFYLNFGTPGVVIGMILLGMVFRTWREILGGRGQTIPLLVAEVILINDIALHIMGSLVGIINGPVVGMIPLVGMHLVLRRFGAVKPIEQSSV